MMLHIRYQGSRSCGFRQKECFTFFLFYNNTCKTLDPGAEHFRSQGHDLKKLGAGLLGDAT